MATLVGQVANVHWKVVGGGFYVWGTPAGWQTVEGRWSARVVRQLRAVTLDRRIIDPRGGPFTASPQSRAVVRYRRRSRNAFYPGVRLAGARTCCGVTRGTAGAEL